MAFYNKSSRLVSEPWTETLHLYICKKNKYINKYLWYHICLKLAETDELTWNLPPLDTPPPPPIKKTNTGTQKGNAKTREKNKLSTTCGDKHRKIQKKKMCWAFLKQTNQIDNFYRRNSETNTYERKRERIAWHLGNETTTEILVYSQCK